MLEHVKRLPVLMDKKHWVRMAICLGPAIVLTKGAYLADLPQWMHTLCSGMLIFALIAYAFWVPIRHQFHRLKAPLPAETPAFETEEIGMNPIDMLHDLIRISGHDAHRAIERIDLEYRLNAQNDLTLALAMAYRRACYEQQILTGNWPQTPRQPPSSTPARQPENAPSSIPEETGCRQKDQWPT